MSESVLSQFDNDVLHCFELSSAIELTLPAAKQASLNLNHGGLGLRSLHRHAPAAYISSLTTSMPSDNCSVTSKVYLLAAVNAYNAMVTRTIEEADFNSLFSDATTMTKARLQAISAPQAHAWLKVQPSPKLGLALMPDEAQVILKWWLGLPLTREGTPCPLCHHNMDAWEHHMLTCRSGGDVITRHNQLRDYIADFCHKACLSPQIEKGSGILPKDQSRPADILVPNWSLSRQAAFDMFVFGGWGNEAINVLLTISKKVATRPLNEVISNIYSRLSLTLMRQNARAILARCVSPNTCCLFLMLMF
ncbi:hypothetical protein EMCRGX_G032986 [Ephydatia muelleri]